MKKNVSNMLLTIIPKFFCSRSPLRASQLLSSLVLVLLLAHTSFAKEIKFNEMAIESADLQKISITGVKGSVKLTPGRPGQKLVLHAKKIIDDKRSSTSESWSFTAKREDGTLKIQVHGPDSVVAAEELRQPPVEFQFEIEASTSLVTEISWREGSVSVQGWNSAVTISLLDGSINLSQCAAPIHIQNETGEIKISNQKGRTEIDSLKAKVFISDSEGNLRIKNFAGESNLQNVSASIHIHSKVGATHIAKSQGSLEIENGKGNFNILDFNGSIHGQNEDGALTAKLIGDVDVVLDSLSGSMSFKLPEKSAAHAKLQSDEGTLSGLESFKNAKLGNAKLLIGRFAGTEKGNIVLKSKTGNLRVH